MCQRYLSGIQHRFWKFEPEKGGLGNYLCIIALRRATERYRKNLSVSRAEEKYRSGMEQSSKQNGEGGRTWRLHWSSWTPWMPGSCVRSTTMV